MFKWPNSKVKWPPTREKVTNWITWQLSGKPAFFFYHQPQMAAMYIILPTLFQRKRRKRRRKKKHSNQKVEAWQGCPARSLFFGITILVSFLGQKNNKKTTPSIVEDVCSARLVFVSSSFLVYLVKPNLLETCTFCRPANLALARLTVRESWRWLTWTWTVGMEKNGEAPFLVGRKLKQKWVGMTTGNICLNKILVVVLQ